jgi:acyl carrier protein
MSLTGLGRSCCKSSGRSIETTACFRLVRPPSEATKAKISKSGAQQRVGNNIMSKAKDLNEMKDWLIKRISTSLKVKNGMDPDAPFSKYGLQSIDAVILAMEIEEEVGVELPPTLLWEYNTVNECASYLVKIGSDIAA